MCVCVCVCVCVWCGEKERRDELETVLKAIVSVYLTQDDETSNLSSWPSCSWIPPHDPGQIALTDSASLIASFIQAVKWILNLITALCTFVIAQPVKYN